MAPRPWHLRQGGKNAKKKNLISFGKKILTAKNFKPQNQA